MYNHYFFTVHGEGKGKLGKGKENKEVVQGKELELQNWSSSDKSSCQRQVKFSWNLQSFPVTRVSGPP